MVAEKMVAEKRVEERVGEKGSAKKMVEGKMVEGWWPKRKLIRDTRNPKPQGAPPAQISS